MFISQVCDMEGNEVQGEDQMTQVSVFVEEGSKSVRVNIVIKDGKVYIEQYDRSDDGTDDDQRHVHSTIVDIYGMR